jgi:hypothetical protein
MTLFHVFGEGVDVFLGAKDGGSVLQILENLYGILGPCSIQALPPKDDTYGFCLFLAGKPALWFDVLPVRDSIH